MVYRNGVILPIISTSLLAPRYHAYRSHVTKAPQPEIIDEPIKTVEEPKTEDADSSNQSRFIKSQRLRSIFYSSKTAALLAFSSVQKNLSTQLTNEQTPSIEIEGPTSGTIEISTEKEKDQNDASQYSGKGKRNLSTGDAVNVSCSQDKDECGKEMDRSLPATPCRRPNPVVRSSFYIHGVKISFLGK